MAAFIFIRYSRSRFELFTMSVSVSDPDFDKGSIFGKLLVKDALGARADGWKRKDAKDFCYISCFNNEWHDSLDIVYDSLIPFGDPSCRRSVPASSSVEVDLLLHAMSESKDQCYLIFHGKHNESLSKFWDEDQEETKCGTLKFERDIGRVLVNFILLKDAVDASMKLTCTSTNPDVPIQICGSIMAYYGDDVVKDDGGILGQYKATIFRTNKFQLTGEQVVLPLHRSLLAVPTNGCLKIEAFFMNVESKEEYVRGRSNYRSKPGTDENWTLNCRSFSINLKVAWS